MGRGRTDGIEEVSGACEFAYPESEAEMLRRAATACRNVQPQYGSEWFDWVPKHLERLATRFDRLAAPSSDSEPREW